MLGELAEAASGAPVVLLRAGISPGIDALEVCTDFEEDSLPQAFTALSNAAPQWNPLAGLAGKIKPAGSEVADAIALMGSGRSLRLSSSC